MRLLLGGVALREVEEAEHRHDDGVRLRGNAEGCRGVAEAVVYGWMDE